MRWYLLLLLGSLSAPALAQRPDTVAARVQVRGSDCALFPVAARWPAWHAPAQPQRRFAPSPAQVRAAERVLAGVSLRALSPSPDLREAGYADRITQQLRQYHRQYFGYYNQQGQPCLYISCLADIAFDPFDYPALVAAKQVPPPPAGHVPHWLRAWQAAADASDGYWWISYNLATSQFFDYGHDLGVGGG